MILDDRTASLRTVCRAALLVAVLCAVLAAPFSAIAQQPVAVPQMPAEEELYELVLQVKRKGEAISNTLLAQQRGFNDYLIPVSGIANILEIYTTVDLQAGKITGWYLKPDNPFIVDARAGTFTVNGVTESFAPGDVLLRDFGSGFGDIYVRHEVLNRILPLEAVLDFSSLSIDILTPARLPYEERLERIARRERLLALRGAGGVDFTGFKFIDNPYRLFSSPAVDIVTSTSWDNSEGRWENRTNLSGKNDLLYFTADYSANFDYVNDDFISPQDLRILLTRRAFGEETMPLGVREVRLGDLSIRAPSLTVSNNFGRGASISSRPLRRSGTFDLVTIEGNATPGWELELYRNAELLDFRTVPDNGYYRFDEVELLAGANVIKAVLYGPEGQVEERIETYQIGAGLLPPGEFEYEASIVDVSDNLISFEERDNPNEGFANDDDGYAYSGSGRVGINNWMSLFATGTNAITREGSEKYATIGTDLSLGPVQANVELYKQVDGGRALDTRISTSLLGWRLNLRHAMMNDFESERVGFDDGARVTDSRGSLSNRFLTPLGQVGLTFSADYEKDQGGRTEEEYQVSKTLSRQRMNFGNRIRARYQNNEQSLVDGVFNSAFRLHPKISMRGFANYTIQPHFEFNSLTANIDYRESKKFAAGLDVTHSLLSTDTTVGANVSYDFDRFLGSLSTVWREQNGVNVTLRVTTSLAPYGKDGDYIMRSRSTLGQTGLNAVVFNDRNLNEVYDEGDSLVEGAVLGIGTRDFPEPSDAQGHISDLLGGTEDYAGLVFRENTTDNPFHASAPEGYRMLLRPGVAQQIEFALVETGVIDGTANFEDGRPVPGLKLQLVDRTGKVVKETLTSFDGYYSFEFAKPGQYAVRPDPNLSIVMPTRLVTISPDALFAYGLDVKLLDKAGLPPSDLRVDEGAARQNLLPVLGALARLQDTLRAAAPPPAGPASGI